MGEIAVKRSPGPFCGQLKCLHRRFCLAGLYEIDRRSADGAVRHLRQAQAGFRPGLLDRTRPDLDAVAPTATARRASTLVGARITFRHCAPAYLTSRNLTTID